MAKPILKPEEAMTLEEFMEQSQNWPGRWEYIDGRPRLKTMVASHAHGLISVNLSRELSNQLRNHPCAPMNNDKKLIINGEGYQPDAGVDCGEFDIPQQENFVYIKPTAVFEILSNSNKTPFKSHIAFQEKISAYKTHPDIKYILIIEQIEPFVLFLCKDQNGEWQGKSVENMEEAIHMPFLDLSLEMKEIYLRVRFPAAG